MRLRHDHTSHFRRLAQVRRPQCHQCAPNFAHLRMGKTGLGPFMDRRRSVVNYPVLCTSGFELVDDFVDLVFVLYHATSAAQNVRLGSKSDYGAGIDHSSLLLCRC